MDAVTAGAAFLLSDAGRDALARARACRGDDALARRRALDAHLPGAEARSVLALDDLRVRAAAKTDLAERLFLTRDALEQATPSAVAADRARRFASFAVVADLGAGVGFDAIAIARAGPRVVAVERDPVRVAFLRRNVAEAGVEDRVDVREGDFLERLPEAEAAFLDPDRRPGGRRTRDAAEFEPPPPAWDRVREAYGHVLVKLPPVPPTSCLSQRLEFVSLRGELKEARLGFGRLAIEPRRRARLLPGGVEVDGEGVPWPSPRAPREGDVLVDPDPAIVVAGLVGDVARAASLAPVHAGIAYLLGPKAPPWGTAIRVQEVLPPTVAALQAAVDRHDVGALTIRTRGVSDPPDTWRRRLRLRGRAHRTLVVTRGPDDRWIALLGA